MKKIIILTMMLLGINMTLSYANEIKIIDRIEHHGIKEKARIEKEEIRNDTVNFYDIRLNESMKDVIGEFTLDSMQREMIYHIQENVEKAFSTLNKMNSRSEKERYMDNIIGYWMKNARIALESTDDEHNRTFRQYWAHVNVTMHKNGYVDEFGDYIFK